MADDERWEEARHTAHVRRYPGNPADHTPTGNNSTAVRAPDHERVGFNEITSWARTRIRMDDEERGYRSWDYPPDSNHEPDDDYG
eukprot:16447492-Heterocapsa_arctica.AAC.1